jgi:hypothetical protein
MEWLAALAAVAGTFAATPLVRRRVRSRRLDQLRTAEVFRLNRHLADEDVTLFGEELMDLHVETLTTQLDEAMRRDYQQALDSYEDAKACLAAAATSEDVTQTVHRLADGRHQLACVLARRDNAALPERRAPCFFDPAHGPSSCDVIWAPPGGVPREIPTCRRDAERVVAREAPQPRLVRLGDRRVPWYAAGPAYEPWATGWYDRLVRDGRFEADRLTMLFAPGVTVGATDVLGAGGWTDPGGWTPGDLGAGHEYGGHDPGSGSGFDFGGFDGGGGGGGDSG